MARNYFKRNKWLLLFLLVASVSGCKASANEALEVNSAPIETDDKIYDNISIFGINVGRMKKDDALAKITNEVMEPIKNQKIILVNEDKSWALELMSLNYDFHVEDAVDTAYNYGRKGSKSDMDAEIESLKNKPFDISPSFSYDEDVIDNFLNQIADEVYVSPTEPTMKREKGVVVTTEGLDGKQLNTLETKSAVVALADKNEGGEVQLVFSTVKPRFSVSDLEKSRDIIGTFQTPITGSASRDVNLTVASNYVNGTLLFPGDVFSTNKTIGETTYERGYRSAPVIVNGKLVQGMGGGVCQVSSTLYNAVLFAELDIVERRNHSLVVGYCPIGRDATLAGDYIDFKFKNSTDAPIYIESYLEGKKLICNIYGVETRPANRTLQFESVYVSSLVVDVYKKVLVDNAVTDRIYIDRSTYKPAPPSEEEIVADPVEEVPENVDGTGETADAEGSVLPPVEQAPPEQTDSIPVPEISDDIPPEEYNYSEQPQEYNYEPEYPPAMVPSIQ